MLSSVAPHAHDQGMYLTSGIALATMVVSFLLIALLGKKFRQDIPIAVNLFVSVALGAVVTGFGVPFRHLFEGPVWYIYINLVIFTGMIFLTCMKHAGNLDCIAYDILTKFRTRPALMFCLIVLLLFFPGMVTGVGTAAVLSTGMVITGEKNAPDFDCGNPPPGMGCCGVGCSM